MELRGNNVLVTGASSGLGLEIARQLARDHAAHVIPVARRVDRLMALRDEVQTATTRVMPVAADLTKLDDIDRVVEEAQRNGPLHAAVLNAGVTHFGDWDELSWADFEQMLALNVTSVVRLATRILPHLVEQQRGGGLLIVASVAGLTPVPYQTAYAGTKAFLVN